MEHVVLGVLPVDEAERIALGVPVDGLGDRRAQHQRVVDILIGALEPLHPVWGGFQPPHRLMGVGEIERIFSPLMREAIDAHQALGEHIVEHDIAEPPPAQGQRLGLGKRRVAQRHEQLERGYLGLRSLCGVKAHATSPSTVSASVAASDAGFSISSMATGRPNCMMR